MFDPASLRALINEHGVTVTLRKKAAGVYNVATGTVGYTNTDYSVKGYFFNNDPSVAEFQIQQNGERRILLSDKLVNGAITPEVTASDEILFSSKTTTVIRTTVISSANSTMCQMCYLRD
jgi:hypothetical protein